MFAFDRLTPRQRRARQLLLPAVALVAVAFCVFVPVFARLLGGVWGEEVMLVAGGAPLAALWWVGETNGSWRGGACRGAGLALAASVAYSWAFA